MARAKRTARADARRRYRAEQGLPDPMGSDDAGPTTTTAAPTSRSTSNAVRPVAADTGPRRGIGTAFREAFRPLDWRTDVRMLPTIALRSKALWLPILLTLASTALFAAVRPSTSTDPLSLIAAFLFQYFIVTPGIGAVFISGFLAPRASWLLGAIVGLVSAACYSFLGLGGFIPIAAGATQPNPRDVVLAAFGLSPILGAIFAASAAWYRRFLQLSNPNRGRARPSSNAARRPDGKTRAAPTKAGVRR